MCESFDLDTRSIHSEKTSSAILKTFLVRFPTTGTHFLFILLIIIVSFSSFLRRAWTDLAHRKSEKALIALRLLMLVLILNYLTAKFV